MATMKTKKTVLSRTIAFFTAFALFLTLVLLIPRPKSTLVSADSDPYSNATPIDQAGMTIDDIKIWLNNIELTKDTTVRNGDHLALYFKWSLPNDYTYTNTVFSCDLADRLNGINLPDQTIPVGDKAVYTINNNTLYIQLLQGASGRSGDCELEGTVNVTKDMVNEDGKFTLKFFDKEIGVIATEFTTPGLYITKENVGSVYYDKIDGNYYQTFRIIVGRNGNDNESVSIKDLASDLFDFNNVKDIKRIDNYGSSYSSESPITNYSTTDNGFSYEIGTVKDGWDNRVAIEYTVKVDRNKILDPSTSWEYRKNTAQLYQNDKLIQTNDGYAIINLPTVSKSGVLSNDKQSITWTITVNLNDYADEFSSDTNNTISLTDSIDSKISAVSATTNDGKKISLNGTNPITLTPSDFTSYGTYTTTYTTDVPQKYQNYPADINISNKTEIEYEDEFTRESTANVNIPGEVKDFVTKSYTVDENKNAINWTVSINVPDIDDIDDKTEISISDYIYSEPYEYYYNYVFFTGNTVYTVTGADNTSCIPTVRYYGDQGFNLNITDTDFIKNNKGNKITVSYTTPIDDNFDKVTNNASVSIITNEATITDNDSASYAKIGTKTAIGVDNIIYYNPTPNTKLKCPMAWQIVAAKPEAFKADDVVTITDTIPEGFEFVKDSLVITGNKYWLGNRYANANNVTFSTDNNTMIIELTLTAEMAAIFNSAGNNIYVAYITQMTNEKYVKFITGDYSNDGLKVMNNAKVTIESGGTELTESTSALQTAYPDGSNLIDKQITNQGQLNQTDDDDYNFYAEYKVVINEEKLPLNSGKTYTAVDTLGKNLELVSDSVTVSANGTAIDASNVYSYDSNQKQIKFTLNDSTKYEITYKVKVNQIYKYDLPSDEDTKAIAELFGNTIAVELNGNDNLNSSICLDSGTYRSKGSYTFDDMDATLTIKGSKIWSGGLIPNEFSVKITGKENKYTLNGSTYTLASSTDITAQVYTFNKSNVTVNGNTWEYTISGLPLYSVDDILGNKTTYTYNVEEVKIDGYTASYETDNTNTTYVTSNSPNVNEDITISDSYTSSDNELTYTLNITNTFEDAKGSLTVNKDWKDGTDTTVTHPEVTFTLTDSTDTKLSASTENSSVTFENLPIYTYSEKVDNNGNQLLVRTPIKYRLAEDSVEGYTTSYSEQEFTLVEISGDVYPTTAEKKVTVTNTKNVEVGDIKLIKKYVDPNSNEPEQTIDDDVLNATKFTLYGESNGTIDINKIIEGPTSPVKGNDNKYIVTFSGKNLSANTNYYLMETSVPNNYTGSDKIFKCSVGSDGTVTYSLLNSDGTGSNESITYDNDNFPVCTNTEKQNKTYSVNISKQAINGTAELTGASLKIYKSVDYDTSANTPNNGAVPIEAWTSSATATTVSLEAGSYVLVEETAPSGYLTAESISFTVTDSGTVTIDGKEQDNNTITMRDAPEPVINLIKTYTDENGNSINADSTIASSTKFTLYKTYSGGTLSDPIVSDKVAAYNNNDNSVTVIFNYSDFKNSLSTTDSETVFYIKETSAPSGYEASNTVFYCKVNIADGTVKYSTDGTNYDGKFPECKNTKTSTTAVEAQPIKLIKKYTVDNTEVTDSTTLQSLANSTVFTLSSADNNSFTSVKKSPVLDNGEYTVTFTKDDGIKPDKIYKLEETGSPDGYTTTTGTFYCKIDSATGNVTYSTSLNGTYTSVFPECTNAKTTVPTPSTYDVTISKQDIAGKELAGAKLKITADSGNDLSKVTYTGGAAEFTSYANEVSFTSGTSPTVLSGVPAGSYTLTEETAPYGYVKAESISFTVDTNGNVTVNGSNVSQIVMTDDYEQTDDKYDVYISKTDINNSSELAGAQLTVYTYSNGTIGTLVDTWTSAETPHNIKLESGMYILVENQAPLGYETAESIAFEVNDNGIVMLIGENGEANGNTVIMKDKPKSEEPVYETGKVYISKKAINGTNELPDAHLQIYRNEELIKSWYSTETAQSFELEPGIYVLVEITAPYGYDIAEDITFSVDENSNITVLGSSGEANGNILTMRDAPKNDDTYVPSEEQYPDYPTYPTYPDEPAIPYYPVEEIPPFLIYPERIDEEEAEEIDIVTEDISSGAGIAEAPDKSSSDMGIAAVIAFISSIISAAALLIIKKRKHS